MTTGTRQVDLRKWNRFKFNWKRNLPLWGLILPAMIYVLLFRYRSFLGIQIAFKNYRITKDMWDCAWTGFKNAPATIRKFYQAGLIEPEYALITVTSSWTSSTPTCTARLTTPPTCLIPPSPSGPRSYFNAAFSKAYDADCAVIKSSVEKSYVMPATESYVDNSANPGSIQSTYFAEIVCPEGRGPSGSLFLWAILRTCRSHLPFHIPAKSDIIKEDKHPPIYWQEE